MRVGAAFVLAAWFGGSAPALAQSEDPRDVAYELATVEAEHTLCGFPLTDEQGDVIAQRRDALVTRGDVSEGEIAAMRDQVSAALGRQRDGGLCRADGPEARLFRRRLVNLGLL